LLVISDDSIVGLTLTPKWGFLFSITRPTYSQKKILEKFLENLGIYTI